LLSYSPHDGAKLLNVTPNIVALGKTARSHPHVSGPCSESPKRARVGFPARCYN